MIGQGKTCHVSIDDDKIMYGIFTERVVLAGHTIAARTVKNTFGTRKTLVIKNMSVIDPLNPNANFFYWGGSDVTTGNGIGVAPGEASIFDFTAKKNVDVFITAAAGVIIGLCEFV